MTGTERVQTQIRCSASRQAGRVDRSGHAAPLGTQALVDAFHGQFHCLSILAVPKSVSHGLEDLSEFLGWDHLLNGVTEADSDEVSCWINHDDDAEVVSFGHLVRAEGSVVKQPKAELDHVQSVGKHPQIDGDKRLWKPALELIQNGL